MNDHLISRSRFLDALVLDADNKTDLIQVHQALEKAVVDPDDVRGVGEWVDKGVRAWSCSCCGTPLNHIRQFSSFEKNELPNYCPNCGARLGNGGTDDS